MFRKGKRREAGESWSKVNIRRETEGRWRREEKSKRYHLHHIALIMSNSQTLQLYSIQMTLTHLHTCNNLKKNLEIISGKFLNKKIRKILSPRFYWNLKNLDLDSPKSPAVAANSAFSSVISSSMSDCLLLIFW